MPTHIPLSSGESPGFRFLGLFPLSSSFPFPVIMTCVLDLYVCLDNQRLIGGIATKRNSHARGKQLLYRYIHMVGTIDLHCHSQLVFANCISLFLSIDIDLLFHVLTDLISIRTKGLPVEC